MATQSECRCEPDRAVPGKHPPVRATRGVVLGVRTIALLALVLLVACGSSKGATDAEPALPDERTETTGPSAGHSDGPSSTAVPTTEPATVVSSFDLPVFEAGLFCHPDCSPKGHVRFEFLGADQVDFEDEATADCFTPELTVKDPIGVVIHVRLRWVPAASASSSPSTTTDPRLAAPPEGSDTLSLPVMKLQFEGAIAQDRVPVLDAPVQLAYLDAEDTDLIEPFMGGDGVERRPCWATAFRSWDRDPETGDVLSPVREDGTPVQTDLVLLGYVPRTFDLTQTTLTFESIEYGPSVVIAGCADLSDGSVDIRGGDCGPS